MGLRRFSRTLSNDRQGTMALFAVGTLLLVIFIAGGVIDYVSLISQRHDLQASADAAALAAAKEIQLSGSKAERLNPVAETVAAANLRQYHEVETVVRLLEKGAGIEVEVSARPRVFFMGPIGANAKRQHASAVAEVSGSPICMIGLDPKAKNTLLMRKKAAITARGCAIYSNSTAKDGITVEDNAVVEAGFICSAGGVKTAKNFALDPKPVTDCPVIADPLESRPAPSVGTCDYTKKKIEKGVTTTLSPGVYCGGLEVKGSVTLSSGVYIIKNGELKVKEGGSLIGEHVGFFLTGDHALINFEKESIIEITAPKTGPLTGLLFYEDRNVTAADGSVVIDPDTKAPKPQEHRIRSDDARRLVGTIYITRNKLLVDGDKPVAAQSEYTIIIARDFSLAEGPEIVLNTDYAHSDVPVPVGVGNKTQKSTRLIR